MTRHVLAFNDCKEVQIERAGNGELLVHARADDPAIDAVGIRVFARPALPGAKDVTLANVPVHFIRLFAREHGGVEPTWTEDAAIELLKAAAASEGPLPNSPDIPDDPPEIAEVLRQSREAAPKAAPFRGPEASVSGARSVHDGSGLRALEIDQVSIAYQDARARFTEEVARPIEPPANPIYARHWNRARGWRAKVSALRIIAEVLDPASEPEHAGHPLQPRIAALRERIAETAAEWRREALLAENDRRAA